MLDSRIRARAVEHLADRIRGHVQIARVLVAERRRHVLPVVGQRRRHILLAGDQDRGVSGRELEERMEVLDRQQLRDVGAIGLVLERGDLRQLAVLLGQLGRGCDLDHLGVSERALRERREPPQRLDLVAEQVDPHRAVLGGREHVEQAAADRELPAILDLVDALVAGGDEVSGGLLQVEQLTGRQQEPMRAKRGSGTFSDSATALTTTTGAVASASSSESSAAMRKPTRCGGGARCDS